MMKKDKNNIKKVSRGVSKQLFNNKLNNTLNSVDSGWLLNFLGVKNNREEKAPVNRFTKGFIDFEKLTGFDKNSEEQLIDWLEKEIQAYKKSQTLFVKKNEIAKIAWLVTQIAKKKGMSVDRALKDFIKKSADKRK
jgi:hypothetical protein